MGQNSKIEWTHHTFNPWWGCVRVSDGCKHCYAETFAKRFGVEWGVNTPRKMASDKYMRQPIKWNKDAQAAGERRRVFCASMADLFEDRDDLIVQRARVFELIELTPWLDWLLLTKRPENMIGMSPLSWRYAWPRNAWAMTTVENQREANRRIPELMNVPSVVRGLSCEPMLEYIVLAEAAQVGREVIPDQFSWIKSRGINWVICGGESGHGARIMSKHWARHLRDQCVDHGVPFHFKQWGEYNERGDKVGKHEAGRLLDGREWNEYPDTSLAWTLAGIAAG